MLKYEVVEMAKYDLVGIGNALVDVLAPVDDSFLEGQGLDKGAMTLVDTDRAAAIYDKMPPGQEISGGSCGNTMAGFASLGGRGAFIGKVRDDQLGNVFRHDMQAIGVNFETPAASEGPATGSCLVLITPDAQRTMCTNLGAASHLGPNDIDKNIIKAAKVVYMEGYLFDPPEAQEAFVEAADAAHDAGRKVALTLSDPFCVDRHRRAFQMLVQNHTDRSIRSTISTKPSSMCGAIVRLPALPAAARAPWFSPVRRSISSTRALSIRLLIRRVPVINTPPVFSMDIPRAWFCIDAARSLP
jgi:hypothetical protein